MSLLMGGRPTEFLFLSVFLTPASEPRRSESWPERLADAFVNRMSTERKGSDYGVKNYRS